MFSILKKEINSFFASPIGYLVIAVFLLLNGLFLWVFKGEFNILDNGVVSLSSFFLLAPWILIFLVPAVTMRSFSDEKKQGTLELLVTKPISYFHIILGKFFGAFILIILTLLPTLLYVYTVSELGNPSGNLDMGSTIGSYFGLLFLVAAYTAIGICASTFSENQIVAFIIAVFICFFFYFGFEGLSNYNLTSNVENLGMAAHYNSMSRGVIDTRDLIYFISITLASFLVIAMLFVFVLLFLFLNTIDKRKWLSAIIGLILTPLAYFHILYPFINIFSSYHHQKYFDSSAWVEKPGLRYEMIDHTISSDTLIGKSKATITTLLGEREWLAWDSIANDFNPNKWNYGLGIEPGAFNDKKECVELTFKDNKLIKVMPFQEEITYNEE